YNIYYSNRSPSSSTGPPGPATTNQPANSHDSGHDCDVARHRVRNEHTTACTLPCGTWTVLYKGQPHTFALPSFNANGSFVVVFPTVTVDANDNLTRIDWVYRNRQNGSVLATVPSFIAGINVRVDVNSSSGDQPESTMLSPAAQT